MSLAHSRLEKIRAYLQGKLNKEEANQFKQALEEDASLREDTAFSQLLIKGLTEYQDQANKKRRSKRILLIASVAVMLVLVIAFYLIHNRSKPTLRPQAITLSSEGDVFVAGQFSKQAEIGGASFTSHGDQDIFIAKIKKNAELEWSRSLGGKFMDTVDDIILDSQGNIIVTGSLGGSMIIDNIDFQAGGNDDFGERDFFIAKFTNKGKLVWIKHAGGHNIPNEQTGVNRGHALAIDASDNILAIGTYIGTTEVDEDTLLVGGPNEDLYLMKLSPGGTVQWAESITGNYMVYGFGIAVDKTGAAFITGMFGHHNLSGHAIFDSIQIESYGGRDIFLAKYSPEGKLKWVRQAGSSRNEKGMDGGWEIATDSKGHIGLTGYFNGPAKFEDTILKNPTGSLDIFTAKYDEEGQLLWVISAGSPDARDFGKDIVFDSLGNCYITGSFSGTAQFEEEERTSAGVEDIFVCKYDPNGTLKWVKTFGGFSEEVEQDAGTSIALAKDGDLYISGFFSGTMSINKTTEISKEEQSIFIVEMDPESGRIKDFFKRSLPHMALLK